MLTADTSYTKAQVDSQIAASSVINGTSKITVVTLSTQSTNGISIYSGSFKTAYINNSGLLNCVSLSCTATDLSYLLSCNSTDGLKYATIISGTDLSTIQTNTTATAIKYKTNTLTVDNNGVSVGGLAVSYFLIMH